MLRLTKKGQASSTFQLLIAAVVALAILGVLLNILNVLPGLNKDPTKTTKTLLTDQMNNPGAESCTDPVTFTRSKSTLSAEGITLNTGLELKQVYFDNPEGILNFDPKPSLLRYGTTASKKVMMCIICSSDASTLSSAIEDNKRPTGDNFASVPNDLSSGETVCVIYPRKTSSS